MSDTYNPYFKCLEWCRSQREFESPRNQSRYERDLPKLFSHVVAALAQRGFDDVLNVDHARLKAELRGMVIRRRYGILGPGIALFLPIIQELLAILIPLVIKWIESQFALPAGDSPEFRRDLQGAMANEARKYL